MKYLKFLPVTIWMIVIFYLSSRTELPHANVFFWEFLFKKSGHVFVYFVLTLLWIFALGSKQLEKAILYTLAYAFTDEIHQLFVPGRTGVLTDILFDSLGIGLALLTNFINLWKKLSLLPVIKRPKK
ncbi:hypothetical protein A2572_00325 [Candidatus Collierbacteria bacterium RIFOXYD1_FULL_40_9]|uniref:VanZ-like domain-containing protein n=1 Tax=Candidatus Collierbacteria bacterium RIFOXYD1_FULL_40_9 TaxID=1817731 RepID=A0A1F5FUI8_9BACT|nr:MAG: hypothetical protein A2572_00325 [Candidatus Collierbacteria bacterium RIFOXYD1_FULL_40_9]